MMRTWKTTRILKNIAEYCITLFPIDLKHFKRKPGSKWTNMLNSKTDRHFPNHGDPYMNSLLYVSIYCLFPTTCPTLHVPHIYNSFLR